MKQNEESKKNIMNVIPSIARKIGEKSVSSACYWWYNQPKVPESMKKEMK